MGRGGDINSITMDMIIVVREQTSMCCIIDDIESNGLEISTGTEGNQFAIHWYTLLEPESYVTLI